MNEDNPAFEAVLEATREVLASMSMLELGVKERLEASPRELELLSVSTFMPLLRKDVADRMLVITLSRKLARRVVSCMLGLEEDELDGDGDLLDGVGELGNMVAGVAKTALAGTDEAFVLSLPLTVAGDADPPRTAQPLVCGRAAHCEVEGEPLGVALWRRPEDG